MSFEDFFDTPKFDYEGEKKRLVDNLDYLKSLSSEENTFYKKYEEVKNYRDYLNRSSVVKSTIWKPTDILNKNETIREIQNLKPKVYFVDEANKEACLDWLMLRVFVHTMPFDQNVGRFLRFVVKDENTDKYLGFISMASDVICISGRDNYIGWSSDDKLKGKLNNSAIASCIAPTQPFGYNFLGGKLIAILTSSSVIRDTWKRLYGDVLAGVTTTSLYGPQSMYNGLPNYKSHGVTSGKVFIKPDDSVYEVWHHWIQENKPELYNKAMKTDEKRAVPVTGAKQRTINMIFKEVGIKSSDYHHSYNRGCYYACIYENSKEFFKNQIKESDLIMKKNYIDDSYFIDWWRNKAVNRYSKLVDENRVNDEVLYHNRMIGSSYKKCKELYFKDVGR